MYVYSSQIINVFSIKRLWIFVFKDPKVTIKVGHDSYLKPAELLDKVMSNTRLPTIRNSNVKMNAKQLEAMSLLKEGQNVFLTGPGGVGKTSVLKSFVLNCKRNIAVTSTTGTSALLLGGSTLHSYLGIGLGKDSIRVLVTRILSQKWLTDRWRNLECLVIDEISMMHPNLFDKLEEVARHVRDNDLPFGGIQLVVSGDFLQLPCIGTLEFCFQAKTWSKCIPNVVYLDKIIRQGDRRFQKCLNSIRLGKTTDEVRVILESRVGARLQNSHGIKPTKLYSKNVDVDIENDVELDKLAEYGAEFYAYEMQIEINPALKKKRDFYVKKLKKFCPVASRLELCKGAQVMLVKNIDPSSGLANGSRGVVTSFTPEAYPRVRFLNGEERVISMEIWEMDDSSKKVLIARQIPLRVAYAISIHKSQGCSLDYAEIDLTNISEFGQAYVALSRVKSLHGLSIIAINYNCIHADPVAVSYYNNLT